MLAAPLALPVADTPARWRPLGATACPESSRVDTRNQLSVRRLYRVPVSYVRSSIRLAIADGGDSVGRELSWQTKPLGRGMWRADYAVLRVRLADAVVKLAALSDEDYG